MPKRRILAGVAFCLSLASALVGSNAPATQAPPSKPDTGRMRLTFSEKSPLSTFEEARRRRGWTMEQVLGTEKSNSMWNTRDYDLAAVPIDVYVPPRYATAGVPYGLLIWLGVQPVPPTWEAPLARHNLILVSVMPPAEGSVAFWKARLALDVVHNMKLRYKIDSARVYTSGMSAGGHEARGVVANYPEVFQGGCCCLMGGRFYETRVDEAGHSGVTIKPMVAWQGDYDAIRKDMAIVVVRGQRDPLFTVAEGRQDAEALKLDGFRRVTFLEATATGHAMPSAATFERALDALSAPQKAPPATAPTKERQPTAAQVAQAERLYMTAMDQPLAILKRGPKRKDDEALVRAFQEAEARARKYLHQILDEYPTTPAAVRAQKALVELNQPRAARAPDS